MPADAPLLDVRHLTKRFDVRRAGAPWRPRDVVRAVEDVSFTIARGETFGLVGESGSGKTTTGRCVLRLIEPTAGEVRFRGDDILQCSPAALRRVRRHVQIVFQDPNASLNPRFRAAEIVEEPLVVHGEGTARTRRARAEELFTLVGLDPGTLEHFPHQFSGGQRQRIGLARALALNPSLIVADEPVSALDVSVQAQILNLLLELQQRLGLTYLFISHDLRLVRRVCDRVGVMYRGRLLEQAPTARLFGEPSHPYTRALIAAVPGFDKGSGGAVYDRTEPVP